ncbi:hypothetical protein L6452_20231 [Arctium lappa]|uniref:Uncharacterized protein n=1 Tax=Arctium lappa TaxID=4217 RepID=A0ACB9BBN3_ARCLA|nr:hypothetical protein L6452_20231 [Arctium lappa]
MILHSQRNFGDALNGSNMESYLILGNKAAGKDVARRYRSTATTFLHRCSSPVPVFFPCSSPKIILLGTPGEDFLFA